MNKNKHMMSNKGDFNNQNIDRVTYIFGSIFFIFYVE